MDQDSSEQQFTMIKLSRIILLFLLVLANTVASFGQTDSINRRPQIAIFTPLYLDSAFDAAGNYRHGQVLPRYINSGLDFFEGAQLAIDSLKKEGVQLDINIYDSRSSSNNIQKVIAGSDFANTGMIIGNVNMNDAQWLAHAAATKNIPFINSNFPNEAGVTENPNYIILNSTLYTHCEGIYKFMQKNYSLTPIVVFRKKGAQDDKLKEYFTEIEKNTASVPLKLKYVVLDDNFLPNQLSTYMNSEKTTVCVISSLDINFASRLCQQLAVLNATHASVVMGMPTLDAVNFSKPDFKGLEIMYSTPFYIAPTDSLAANISDDFYAEYYTRPSDMVYRGYETVYHFAHLLLNKTATGLPINDHRHKIFYDFDIQPVINKKTSKTDYYENKKLYFIKKIDGSIKAVY